jgi:hypothetical protein
VPHHKGPFFAETKRSPFHGLKIADRALPTFYPGRARVNRGRRLDARVELGVGSKILSVCLDVLLVSYHSAWVP